MTPRTQAISPQRTQRAQRDLIPARWRRRSRGHGLRARCGSLKASRQQIRMRWRRERRALRMAWCTWPTSRRQAEGGERMRGLRLQGTGLYVSVLLRPKIIPADALWLSLAAGLAVHDAVERVTSLKADLRWPNDLLFGRRKFCGILTEMNAEVTRIRHMVIGIGINVLQPEFPPELRDVATSLHIETGKEWPRQELLTALLEGLDREVNALTAARGTEQAAGILARLEQASVVDSWQARVRGRAGWLCGRDGGAGCARVPAHPHAGGAENGVFRRGARAEMRMEWETACCWR